MAAALDDHACRDHTCHDDQDPERQPELPALLRLVGRDGLDGLTRSLFLRPLGLDLDGHEQSAAYPIRNAMRYGPRMTQPIRRVAVLGAGVMGSGIAAHCANAGVPVLLLDIVPPDGKGGRNAFANGAMEKLKKAKPAAFMAQRNAILIQTGNFDDDLAKVADCDLIIEAIVERIDIKIALFEKLEKLAASHAIIASNTSGLRIADMLVGRTPTFKQNFMVTHF